MLANLMSLEPSDPSLHEGLHILVAEDSSITQDLLKLVLQQRGHSVDIVEDGAQALAALSKTAFDLVLLDFHLPKMNGMEVLTNYLNYPRINSRPRFVAVTADVEGLLMQKQDGISFDQIVSKPLNIQEILSIIDEVIDKKREDVSSSTGGIQATIQPIEPQPSVAAPPKSAFADGARTLHWPKDFDQDGALIGPLSGTTDPTLFDAIVIDQPARAQDLSFLWQGHGLHLLPLIDMTGSFVCMASIDASMLASRSEGVIDGLIEGFHKRRGMIHRAVLESDKLSDKILARLFVSNSALEPSYSSQSRMGALFNIALDSETVLQEANKLQNHGFLVPHFFDRFHVCNGCGGTHFNIREECPSCHSSHLEESSYIHHFKCAHQAPEADFIVGDELICPKCRQRLLHFGSDYDKPGSVISCKACGHKTSEPDVGFLCLECHTHTNGDTIKTRDIHSYTLHKKALGLSEHWPQSSWIYGERAKFCRPAA